MAGKRQKPYEQLQNKRGNRRRPTLILLPNRPAVVDEEPQSERMRAIDVAIANIERQFGHGPIRERANGSERRGKRRYKPRSERRPNERRKQQAAARPRDEKGHFLPRQRRPESTA